MDQKIKFELIRFEKDEKFKEKFKYEKNKFEQELESKEIIIKNLNEEKVKMQNEVSGLLKKIESQHLKSVEELEKLYEIKINHENKKYIELERKMLLERVAAQKELSEIAEKNLHEIVEMKSDTKNIEQKFRQKEKTHEIKIRELENLFQNNYKEEENRHISELNKLKEQFKENILELEAEISNLKVENENLKRQTKNINSENNKREKERQLFMKEKSRLEELTEKLKEKDLIMQDEMKKVLSRLSQKEIVIEQFKRRITELEKLKNVLCFKNDELNRLINPKNEQIEELKSKLERGEGECDMYLEKIRQKSNFLNFESSKLKEKNREIKLAKEKIKKLEKLVSGIEQSVLVILNDSSLSIHPQIKLIHTFLNTFRQKKDFLPFIKQNMTQSSKMVLKELSKQVYVLENDIISQDIQNSKGNVRNLRYIYKKIDENYILIHEINELRQNNKNLALEVKNLESKLRAQQIDKTRTKSKHTTKHKGVSSSTLPHWKQSKKGDKNFKMNVGSSQENQLVINGTLKPIIGVID